MDDSNPHPSETEKKRRRLLPVVLIGAAAVAGLTTAVLLSGLRAGADTTTASANQTITSSATPSTSTDTEIVLVHPDVTPTPTPTRTRTVTVTPGSSSSSTQTVTNNSGSVKVTPKPSTSPKPTTPPKPAANTCPDTRAENPDLYDACRAGFVDPQIVVKSLVSCVAADSTDLNWYVTLRFGLVGGNYAKYEWAGGSPERKFLIRGLRKADLATGSPIDIGGNMMVTFYAMNGYDSMIRVIKHYASAELNLSSCQ